MENIPEIMPYLMIDPKYVYVYNEKRGISIKVNTIYSRKRSNMEKKEGRKTTLYMMVWVLNLRLSFFGEGDGVDATGDFCRY